MARNDFDYLSFIQSAISKDELRGSMLKAYYDKEANCLVGTDSHRLHVWYPESIKLEEYGLDTSKSTYVDIIPKNKLIVANKMDWTFPNYKKILDRFTPDFIGDRDSVTFTKQEFTSEVAIFLVRNSIAINIKFLKDISNNTWEVFFLKDDKSNKPVKFSCDGAYGKLISIIMPLSIKN